LPLCVEFASISTPCVGKKKKGKGKRGGKDEERKTEAGQNLSARKISHLTANQWSKRLKEGDKEGWGGGKREKKKGDSGGFAVGP